MLLLLLLLIDYIGVSIYGVWCRFQRYRQNSKTNLDICVCNDKDDQTNTLDLLYLRYRSLQFIAGGRWLLLLL